MIATRATERETMLRDGSQLVVNKQSSVPPPLRDFSRRLLFSLFPLCSRVATFARDISIYRNAPPAASALEPVNRAAGRQRLKRLRCCGVERVSCKLLVTGSANRVGHTITR
jgi:hypothetical protein